MRAAAIFGPGNLAKSVAVFQRGTGIQWTSLIEQADALVIFGGDGTVHRHISTLVELAVPLMVVPCGSGNDLARALGLRKVRDSVAAWQSFAAERNNVRGIDLGVIRSLDAAGPQARGEHYFCCIAGVGLDAEITRRANQLPRWIRAHGGYGLAAPREFLRFAPFPMRVCLDGNSADGSAPHSFRPTTLVAVANARTYGGGMKIAPQAKLDDGKLDVCLVRGMTWLKLFCLFPTVYFGQHLRSDKVDYVQTESARIETEAPLDVYADGEYVCQTPVEFSVARNALKVIVPE